MGPRLGIRLDAVAAAGGRLFAGGVRQSVENQAKMQVKLIDYAQQPLEKLYAAFRTCYSSDTPIEVWEKYRFHSW